MMTVIVTYINGEVRIFDNVHRITTELDNLILDTRAFNTIRIPLEQIIRKPEVIV